MNKNISDIYNSLQEIALHFGNHGINGECCGDLSLIEFMALKKANEKSNPSIQEIGLAINFTKSGATRIIDRLESKGYVVREHSSADGRVCCVTVTVVGKETIRNIMEKYTVYLDDVLKDLKPLMVDKIKDVLEILVKSVQQHAPI
jgi:MarR family transcriptional regulator, organic hydroperoxide resistance regulator